MSTPTPVAVLLLLLSVAVLTVVIDRGRWWVQWWRGRQTRTARWNERERLDQRQAEERLEDWDLAMRFGEPVLQASALLAPLLGLIGTVLGLMEVLSALGPQLLLPAGTPLQGYAKVLLSTAQGLILALVASASLALNQGLRRWQLGRLRRSLRRGVPLQP